MFCEKEPPLTDVAELRKAIQKVIDGDPLDFVNAFMRRPLGAPPFPREYWEKRICAVAELMSEAGKTRTTECVHGI